MFKLVPPRVVALMGIGMLAFAPSAHASLIGDTITVQMTGDFGATTNVVVGNGVEIGSDFGNLIDPEFIDIGSESVSGHWEAVLFANPQTIILSDIDWVGMAGEIVGIDNFMSQDANFTESAISFTPHSITIDVSGLVAEGDWSFDIVADHAVTPGQTEIPEPPAFAILGIGLAGLGFVRRRKTT